MANAQTQLASEKAGSGSFLNIFGKYLPWVIWVLGAVFYAYEYLLRVTPSVMADDLMRSFHLTGYSFGAMSALYYWAYTPLQLPVGVLMDRYGPRRLLTFASLMCALGSYMFVQTDHIAIAQLGRFLVGFGSAFAFVGVLKLATIWFTPHRFAMLSGLASALGVVGAMVGDVVMGTFVESLGWLQTVVYSAHFGIFLALILFLIIRDQPKGVQVTPTMVSHEEVTFKDVWANFLRVVANPSMWIVGLIGCLLYLPTTAIADLWGIHYLEQARGFTKIEASYANACIFLGWGLFAPVSGYFSDRIQQRRRPMIIGGIVAAILMCIIIYVPNLPHWGIFALLFIFGASYSIQPIVFAVAREISPHRASGTAVATTNMFVMLGGLIFQPIVGELLDWWGQSHVVNGITIYSVQSYQVALSVVPIGLVIATVLTMLLRETYTKHDVHSPLHK